MTVRWLLGVDGGGSKTDAVVAALDDSGQVLEKGRGQSGPSNLRLAGRELALASLTEAVAGAMTAAGLASQAVDFGILALAGSNCDDVRAEVGQWARQSGWLQSFDIVHDAAPVLVAGTPHGQGVALIVGTGSVATGVSEQGRNWTCGGWGHWFGDLGSGYHIGRRALAAASEVHDGLGPETELYRRILAHFDIDDLRNVMPLLAHSINVRQSISALAPTVIEAAEGGDPVAREILAQGADYLAGIVTGVATRLGLAPGFPIALAGGVVCRHPSYRELLLKRLEKLQPAPGPVVLVAEPVTGCLEMARRRLSAPDSE